MASLIVKTNEQRSRGGKRKAVDASSEKKLILIALKGKR